MRAAARVRSLIHVATPGPHARYRADAFPAANIMQSGLLPPKTPLPSGWSIEPVSGLCVRLSDGVRVGPATSLALALSHADIGAQQPVPTGAALDVARLRNALGYAADGNRFTGSTRGDRAVAESVKAIGAELAGTSAGAWSWRPARGVAAAFNQRLGGLLDAVVVERASLPVAGSATPLWLLTGRIGCLAVRSALMVHDAEVARVELSALRCADVGAALRQARTWAIDAARAGLPLSASATLAFVRHITYHEHDPACIEISRVALQQLAAEAAAPPRAAAAH